MTRNCVYQRLRIERFRSWLSGSAEDAAGNLAGPSDPELGLEQAQRSAQVQRVLDQLKERDRSVLVLFELEERSGNEVAEMLDVPTNTLWVWLHRARKNFRERFEALERSAL